MESEASEVDLSELLVLRSKRLWQAKCLMLTLILINFALNFCLLLIILKCDQDDSQELLPQCSNSESKYMVLVYKICSALCLIIYSVPIILYIPLGILILK